MERAERDFQSGAHSHSIKDMPLAYRDEGILHIFRVLARKSKEINHACDGQVKTRVTPYHEALQAFHSATDIKIHVLFNEIFLQL